MKNSSERPIITLLSDYGSLYPAQMKGAILSRTRDAVLVEIAHDVPPQDVRAGAFALMAAARHFPAGTVHLAVVDPGVGTDRLGIVVESCGHIFVGPDNGLLIPAAKSVGEPAAWMIGPAFVEGASPTFQGGTSSLRWQRPSPRAQPPGPSAPGWLRRFLRWCLPRSPATGWRRRSSTSTASATS